MDFYQKYDLGAWATLGFGILSGTYAVYNQDLESAKISVGALSTSSYLDLTIRKDDPYHKSMYRDLAAYLTGEENEEEFDVRNMLEE